MKSPHPHFEVIVQILALYTHNTILNNYYTNEIILNIQCHDHNYIHGPLYCQ